MDHDVEAQYNFLDRTLTNVCPELFQIPRQQDLEHKAAENIEQQTVDKSHICSLKYLTIEGWRSPVLTSLVDTDSSICP